MQVLFYCLQLVKYQSKICNHCIVREMLDGTAISSESSTSRLKDCPTSQGGGTNADRICSHSSLFCSILTYLDLFEPILTQLDQLSPIWTHLNPFEPIWTHFDPCEPTLHNWEPFGLIWTCLDLFGPIWTKLDLFEACLMSHVTCYLSNIKISLYIYNFFRNQVSQLVAGIS